MNVKTMEGLAGAGTSISMVATPMSAAKEAERKGDTNKMQRALGYAAGLMEQAGEYGEKTSQGMKLEAEEARKQEELRQKQLTETRKKEQEEQKQRTEEGSEKTDSPEYDAVKISEEGKRLAEISGQTALNAADNGEKITYDQSGETVQAVQTTGQNIDVNA